MGGTGKWTGKWGLRLLGAIDIALCLFIAYMHEAEEGTDKGMDSGVFEGRFKASSILLHAPKISITIS